MSAARHSAVRVSPADPCPFCGCGEALSSHTWPRRAQTRRVKHYAPCGCTFCEAGRTRAHTVKEILGTFAFLGGICSPVVETAAELSPAYQAHLDAGEVAVPDVDAGGYRWEKGGDAA